MAQTRYAWRPGTRFSKDADPQKCGVELQRLQRDNDEQLTPRIVVDEARHEQSPLHACFEWDDVRAAELQREHQARTVLNSIRVVHLDTNTNEPTLTHVFVNVEEPAGEDSDRSYVTVAKVLSRADLFQQVRDQFARDMDAFERRYHEFEELARIAHDAKQQAQALPGPMMAEVAHAN